MASIEVSLGNHARRSRDWAIIAAILIALAALLVGGRQWFSHDRELAQVPALWLCAGLIIAGIAYLALVPLIKAAEPLKGRSLRSLVRYMIIVGLVLRAILLWSTPALEDDVYRYLWDGGVVISGHNPYAIAPSAAEESGTAPDAIKQLAEQAGQIHTRINHPDLRTIYPPVAEAAFALAHLAEPWSLISWRLICLGAEIATLTLLLALLKDLHRSPLWATLYWWNPIVIKELINSAHMEAILMPLLLAALLLAARKRPVTAAAMLSLAAGAKLWPIILAPLVLRPLLQYPARLIAALAIMGGACLLWAAAPFMAGFGEDSGFVAYATAWQTNSALTPTLQHLFKAVLTPIGGSAELAGRAVRVCTGLVVAGVAIYLAIKPLAGPADLISRATLIIATLYLLSPAQFPWYLIWLQPLLSLHPIRGWLIATPLVAIYYASFYFHGQGTYWIFRDIVVWAIWLPIWALLANDAWRKTSAT